MADKYKWTRTEGNRRYRAIYTAPFYDGTNRADTGNYNSLGQFVGSMRSIAAPTWETQIGRPPTAQDMQSITAEQAENIYFVKYWDKIKGDQINSQKLAELIADVKSSTGNAKLVQKALGTAQTGTISDVDIEKLNAEIAKDAQSFYNRYRAILVDYYTPISNGNHIARLDRDYPVNLKIDTIGSFERNKKVIIVLCVLGGSFLSYKYYNSPKAFFLLLLLIPVIPPL